MFILALRMYERISVKHFNSLSEDLSKQKRGTHHKILPSLSYPQLCQYSSASQKSQNASKRGRGADVKGELLKKHHSKGIIFLDWREAPSLQLWKDIKEHLGTLESLKVLKPNLCLFSHDVDVEVFYHFIGYGPNSQGWEPRDCTLAESSIVPLASRDASEDALVFCLGDNGRETFGDHRQEDFMLVARAEAASPSHSSKKLRFWTSCLVQNVFVLQHC